MMLSCAIDGGELTVAELVQNLGADGAWAKIIEGVLGEPAAQRAAGVNVDVFERLAKAAAARFVVPGDDEWPAGLDDLRHAESIQRRGGEPVGLWLRGPGHLAHLMERSVAIVGSRAATAYGSGIATDLAADLVEQGVTVLSGGAFGIDVAAHRGALAAGGPTVCVLANGVDVAYPPGHASIFESLARDQLLVSELPPSAHPTRVRFLARNRMIAAMSRGTLVVEAALRSGARNTAGWALGCGRPLMAVPGPVYSRASTTPRAPNRQAGRPTIRIRPTQRLRLSQVKVASVPRQEFVVDIGPVVRGFRRRSWSRRRVSGRRSSVRSRSECRVRGWSRCRARRGGVGGR